jgi:hypothetical protein
MTLEDLKRRIDELERKVDALRANSLQQNSTIAVASLRVKGTPNEVYYEVSPDNTNPASVVWDFKQIGKQGT